MRHELEAWLPGITALVTELQKGIGDEYRSSGQEDDTPSMDITVATDDECSEWTFQTGDNSFMGSCYHYPHWAVTSITRDDDPASVAQELLNQLDELVEDES